MKIKIFSLRFDEERQCFDDAAMDEFLRGKEVLAFREVYFERNGENYWNILLHWKACARTDSSGKLETSDKKNYMEILTTEDVPLFEELRIWRNTRAKQAGISAYIIMSNIDLANIARRRPTTVQSLGQIPGIGDKKTENYGQEILNCVNRFTATQHKEQHEPRPDPETPQ